MRIGRGMTALFGRASMRCNRVANGGALRRAIVLDMSLLRCYAARAHMNFDRLFQPGKCMNCMFDFSGFFSFICLVIVPVLMEPLRADENGHVSREKQWNLENRDINNQYVEKYDGLTLRKECEKVIDYKHTNNVIHAIFGGGRSRQIANHD